MIRLEAYQTILKIFKDREFSDTLLHQKSKKLKQEKQNVALFYSMVKGVVKQRAHLDYIISQYTDPAKYAETDIKIKIILYLGIYQLKFLDSIPAHAAIFETVELAKQLYGNKIADFVNAVLRAWQNNPEVVYPQDPVQRISVEHSYPAELIKTWQKLWGLDDCEYLAIYFNENPKLHLRVNATATNSGKLLQYFQKRNVELQKSPYSEIMLTTSSSDEVLDDVAFSEGYFSVQDTSAALVVDLLDPQPGENVLDLFAAPGGKCTYMAEKMDNTGEIVAVDKIPNKMKLLKQAADRLQLTNLKLIVADALRYGPVAPAYDRVLVDAPCSGWGVIGKKADLRWNSLDNIGELLKLQEKALDQAANFVNKNGTLVYSTCTMNPRENEEQIEKFLKRNSGFELFDAGRLLPKDLVNNKLYKTLPFKHHMDGAFAARLVRRL